MTPPRGESKAAFSVVQALNLRADWHVPGQAFRKPHEPSWQKDGTNHEGSISPVSESSGSNKSPCFPFHSRLRFSIFLNLISAMQGSWKSIRAIPFRPSAPVRVFIYASHPGWSETGAILPFLCRKVGRKAGQPSEVQEYRNPGSGSLTLQPSRIFIPLSLCPLYLLGRGLLRLSDKVIREYRPFPAMKNDSTLQMSPAISILSSNIPSPSGPE